MGETGNILYDLAKGNSVIQEKIENFDEVFVKSNGEPIPLEKIEPYYKVFQEVLDKSHDKGELISDIFKNHIEQLESSDKEIITQYFKNLVESLTPAVNWDRETGTGISTFEALPGSTAISLKTGMNALLYMIMVRVY